MKSNVLMLLLLILLFAGVALVILNFDDSASNTNQYSEDSEITKLVLKTFSEVENNQNESEHKPRLPHTISTNTQSQAFDYGECYSYDEKSEAKISDKRQDYLQSLRDSSHKNDQLVYAIFNVKATDKSQEAKANQNKLTTLLAIGDIKNPLIAIEILSICSVNHQQSDCNNTLIEKVAVTHKNDASVWFQVLYYYLNTQQDKQAFDAIEQVKQSSYSSSYFYHYLSTYAQELEIAGVGNLISNTIDGIGRYAAKVSPLAKPAAWCRENLHKPNYAQACLDIGTLLEQKGSEIFDKHMGLAFQELVYKAEQNTDAIALAEQRKEAISPSYLSDAWYIKNTVSETIFQHEKLLREFIANMETLGEKGAQKPLEEEVIAFVMSEQYEDCSEN